jgi:hypothetical protein
MTSELPVLVPVLPKGAILCNTVSCVYGLCARVRGARVQMHDRSPHQFDLTESDIPLSNQTTFQYQFRW